MTADEQDELRLLKAQLDQMRTELDDALAALWSMHRRGELYKMERFPARPGSASARVSMRPGGSTRRKTS